VVTVSDDELDPDGVRWTAQHRTVNAAKHPDAPGKDGRKSWGAAFHSGTQLRYLNAEWVDVGNPDTTSDEDGCWQHTFMLSSFGLGLKPYFQYGTKHVSERTWPAKGVDFVPAFENAASHADDGVRSALRERNPEVSEPVGRPNDTVVDAEAEMEIKSLPGFPKYASADGEMGESALAISVRRDRQLFGFAHPESLSKALLRAGGDAAPADSLDLANALTVDPTDDAFWRVREYGPNDRVDRVMESQARADEQQALFKSWLGLNVGLAGELIAVTGVSIPVLPAALTVAGTSLAVLGFLAALEDALDNDAESGPPYKGIYQGYPYGKWPGAACFALFDVYTAPNSSVNFSVRVRHDAEAHLDDARLDSPGTSEQLPTTGVGETAMWAVHVESPGPNPEAVTGADRYAAEPWSPSKASELLSNGTADDHEIRYEDSDDPVVGFRPEPTFSMEPGEPTAGEEVVFDASNTMLGGAPIERYEWTLSDVSRDESDEEGSRSLVRTPVALESPRSEGGDLFAGEDEGVLTAEMPEPGYYEMKLTVWDEHHDEGFSATKLFRVAQPEPDPEVTVTLDASTKTAAVGDTVTFEASASVDGGDSAIPTPGPLPGPGTDAPRFAFEWAVVRDLPVQPPSGREPRFREPEDWTQNTYEESFAAPGDHEVYVRATDSLTGASGTAVAIVSVTDGGETRFRDDFEDGDYESDPPWRFHNDMGETTPSVVERDAPDGGSHALRLRKVSMSWDKRRSGWDGPWRVRGLFSPSNATPSHRVWLRGNGDPSLILGEGSGDRPVEIGGVRADRIETTVSTHAIDWQPDAWYRYEWTHDGDGRYACTLWREGEGKPDEPQVVSRGSPPTGRPNYVGLTVSTREGHPLDYAFMEWTVGVESGGSDDLSVTATTSTEVVAEGEPVTFEATASDGAEPLSYEWRGHASGSGPTTTETYSSQGKKTGTVAVTDADGRTATASVGVFVRPEGIEPT
jgi:hypothetical protein